MCDISNCKVVIKSKQPSNLITHIKGCHREDAELFLLDIHNKNSVAKRIKRNATTECVKIQGNEVDLFRAAIAIGFVCEDLTLFSSCLVIKCLYVNGPYGVL